MQIYTMRHQKHIIVYSIHSISMCYYAIHMYTIVLLFSNAHSLFMATVPRMDSLITRIQSSRKLNYKRPTCVCRQSSILKMNPPSSSSSSSPSSKLTKESDRNQQRSSGSTNSTILTKTIIYDDHQETSSSNIGENEFNRTTSDNELDNINDMISNQFPSSITSSMLGDWTASSTIGSFLLKRMKLEEDELKNNINLFNYMMTSPEVEMNLTTKMNNKEKDKGESKDNEYIFSNNPKVQHVEIIDESNERGIQRHNTTTVGDERKSVTRSDSKSSSASSITTEKKNTNIPFLDNILGFLPFNKNNNKYSNDENGDDDDDDKSNSQRGGKVKKKKSNLNPEMVKEVDEAVIPLYTTKEELMKEIKVLPMNLKYQVPQKSTEDKYTISDRNKNEESATVKLPLSDPRHINRIEHDMRRLAVSVTSTMDDPQQWKLFCEDGGGLLPLLLCIREGAQEVRQGRNRGLFDNDDDDDFTMLGLVQKREVAFSTACSACKALRDLCGMSNSFAAVVTDGMIRADVSWSLPVQSKTGKKETQCKSDGLIYDLVTLLRYSGETEALYSKEKLRRLRARGVNIKGFSNGKQRKESRRRCALYVVQLLLAMACSSDAAVNTLRETTGLIDTVLACSSYAQTERLRRRYLRYPIEVVKKTIPFLFKREADEQSPFLAAASLGTGLTKQIHEASNQLLAALGYNTWYPKSPKQKGLRILCIDGGGTRGITAISSMRALVKAMGGVEVCDAFDIIGGTSTGAIIAFLVGLRRESNRMAKKRYDQLIKRIFVKSALSAPMLVFTTATYDETPFNTVMGEILLDNSMLSSRKDPRVPLVFAVSSKMSSTPTQLCLFRNYNYSGGEKLDTFVMEPEEARRDLGLGQEDDIMTKISDWGSKTPDKGIVSCLPRRVEASRHPGSFRALQRAALRASTAAPTVFKPVLMGEELYCDGGIVASNPTAIAIHEARTIYPKVPIELIVSIGTGAFIEEKNSPRVGWDGIISQIVNSATDGEQTHHILEDILGQGTTTRLGASTVSKTRYYRFNPIVG